MKNKIIFIANNNLGNGLSGGDRIFLEFLRHWQYNNQITVFACQETVNLIKEYKINKIKLVNTTDKVNKANYFNILELIKHNLLRTFFGIKTILNQRQIIKQANYVYSVSDFYPDFIPAFLIKIFYPKIKWIVGYYLFAPNPFSKKSPYYQNSFIKGFLYWLIQQPTYLITKLFADIVFITSKPDQKKFLNKKIVIVQGGVDTKPSKKYFLSHKTTQKFYDAVFIGRLHPQKGVLELIDIWKIVVKQKPQAQLVIIGDGQLEKQIKKKISSLKLNKNIQMLGFLDGKEKYLIFQKSKIVVHPAVYDSGGMAAAEAMAWGLPSVSFDIEALKTYYPKGMLKSPLNNYQHFAKNIIKLLKDKKLYNRTSSQALDLIRTTWDWNKRSQNIYKQIFRDK